MTKLKIIIEYDGCKPVVHETTLDIRKVDLINRSSNLPKPKTVRRILQ